MTHNSRGKGKEKMSLLLLWLLQVSYFAMSGVLIIMGWLRKANKPPIRKENALMHHLIHRRCENPHCTQRGRMFQTSDEECRTCGNVLIEPCLEDIVDMQEAELQIKDSDVKMAVRYNDLLRQFPPDTLRHDEAIMLVMLERRCQGQFTWHPTAEYTLPISEDNAILREQREHWRHKTNR